MKRLSPFLLVLLSVMVFLSFNHTEVHAYSEQQFQFEPRDELTGGAIEEGVNVTAYYKIGGYIGFYVPPEGLLWNASYDVLYFSFNLSNGVFRHYWLLDGEDTGTIYIYGGDYSYGVSNQPYILQFYDLAGVLSNYSYIEIISSPNAAGFATGIIERRKLDVEKKVQTWAIHGQLYTIKIRNNITTYTFGDLFFGDILNMPLTLKGLDFPQRIILAYQYNRIYAERYNNFSTIKVTYQDTQGDLANVSLVIYFLNNTQAASTSYTNTASFVYTWLLAQYNETYYVQVTITHSVYGTMNYNAIFYRGGYNVSPWNFPIGSLNPNVSTADLFPMFIIGGCFFIFSKINAHVAGLFAIAVAIAFTVMGWISIPMNMVLLSLITIILFAIGYAKKRVIY